MDFPGHPKPRKNVLLNSNQTSSKISLPSGHTGSETLGTRPHSGFNCVKRGCFGIRSHNFSDTTGGVTLLGRCRDFVLVDENPLLLCLIFVKISPNARTGTIVEHVPKHKLKTHEGLLLVKPECRSSPRAVLCESDLGV